jgi:hypothetical protein
MTMVLHMGARYVNRRALAAVPVPPAVARYFPVAHHDLADMVQLALEQADFRVVGEKHGLSKNGAKYFGYYELASIEDYAAVVGFRSSYDKTLAIRVALGSRVFLCDNLALSGDIAIFRKHTTNVLEDFHNLLIPAIEQLPAAIAQQGVDFTNWKGATISQKDVDHYIAELYRGRVLTRSLVGEAMDEFLNPAFDHGPATLWRLFNAITQVLKSDTETGAIVNLPARTQKLHTMVNMFLKG